MNNFYPKFFLIFQGVVARTDTFGLLSSKCKNEQEFIDKAEQMLHAFKKAKPEELLDAFFGEVPDIDKFHQTIDKIFKNLEKVKKIPLEKRHFEF